MWTKSKSWAKENPLHAVTFAALCLLVLASAGGFISARSAASRYFAWAKGWAAAYDRDIAATKKEYEKRIKVLTDDRDAYRKKWEAARGKMDAPWKAPSNAKALQKRFNRMGYRGNLR